VHLIKHKDEVFDMFLTYKAEVENQLNIKIERIRSDRGDEYIFLMNIVLKKVLFMKYPYRIHLNLME